MTMKKSSKLKSLKDFKLDAEKIKDIQSSIQGGTLAVNTRCVEKLSASAERVGSVDGSLRADRDAYLYD